jgi:hypothetical protein
MRRVGTRRESAFFVFVKLFLESPLLAIVLGAGFEFEENRKKTQKRY